MEFIENNRCDRLSVNITENAGRTLAGDNGTDLGTRTAEMQIVCLGKCNGGRNREAEVPGRHTEF